MVDSGLVVRTKGKLSVPCLAGTCNSRLIVISCGNPVYKVMYFVKLFLQPSLPYAAKGQLIIF